MAENEKRLSEEELDSVAGGFVGECWYYTGEDYDLQRVAAKYGYDLNVLMELNPQITDPRETLPPSYKLRVPYLT